MEGNLPVSITNIGDFDSIFAHCFVDLVRLLESHELHDRWSIVLALHLQQVGLLFELGIVLHLLGLEVVLFFLDVELALLRNQLLVLLLILLFVLNVKQLTLKSGLFVLLLECNGSLLLLDSSLNLLLLGLDLHLSLGLVELGLLLRFNQLIFLLKSERFDGGISSCLLILLLSFNSLLLKLKF